MPARLDDTLRRLSLFTIHFSRSLDRNIAAVVLKCETLLHRPMVLLLSVSTADGQATDVLSIAGTDEIGPGQAMRQDQIHDHSCFTRTDLP